MTINSSRALIRELNLLDLDETPFEDVLELSDKLFDGLTTIASTTGGAELFFRARVNPASKPTLVSELGAPPSEAVVGFQRCNIPGSPMLYVASKRRTALLESRAKKGDFVYLGQWIGTNQLPINKLLIATNEEIDRMDELGVNSAVYGFMETMFTKRVHADFSNDYKISAALTERMTTNFPVRQDRATGDDGNVGLRYPSIFDKRNSFNTCFHPASVADRMKLLHVTEAVVEQAQGTHVDIRVLDTAYSFKGGQIEWTGTSYALPWMREDDGSVTLRSNGVDWLAAVHDKPISAAELRNLLTE